jgi:REP element-mobilizing transposase RayT
MKIRKGEQLKFFGKKGRPAKHDRGIRHIERPKFSRPRSFHLTIKVKSNKADIQSKKILKALHHAIKRARLKQLKIIHYTLEYNHVHLLVEAANHNVLHSGMQALGISFAKAINKAKTLKGTVYKHRYHFRQISSPRDMKNVLHYIFHNGVKHKRASSPVDFYNSYLAWKKAEIKLTKFQLEWQRLLFGILDS